MISKVVLHKRNGHRPPPGRGVPSSRELVTLVHSAPASLSDVDAAKLGAILSSERAGALRTWPSDGARALDAALARTREALARGELPHLRAALDELTSRADLAASLVEQLAESVRAHAAAAHAAPRALVGINDVVLQALGRYCAEAPATVEASSCLEPQLPPVAGNGADLAEAFLDLVRAAMRSAEASGRPGKVALRTSRDQGVLRGERIVRIVITDGDGAAAPGELRDRADLAPDRAAAIVEEHGGILSAATSETGRVHFTIELPAI